MYFNKNGKSELKKCIKIWTYPDIIWSDIKNIFSHKIEFNIPKSYYMS